MKNNKALKIGSGALVAAFALSAIPFSETELVGTANPDCMYTKVYPLFGGERDDEPGPRVLYGHERFERELLAVFFPHIAACEQ